MRFIQMAAIGIMFSLFGYKISAESLSDIYQLALENDAQLKAEKATYKAQKEQKYVALAPLLPQISAAYRLQNQDSTTVRESINFSSNGALVAVDTTTKTDIDPDLIKVSAISKACSPVSGCEIKSSSVFTPNFFAYTGSMACSASTKAHVPPAF